MKSMRPQGIQEVRRKSGGSQQEVRRQLNTQFDSSLLVKVKPRSRKGRCAASSPPSDVSAPKNFTAVSLAVVKKADPKLSCSVGNGTNLKERANQGRATEEKQQQKLLRSCKHRLCQRWTSSISSLKQSQVS